MSHPERSNEIMPKAGVQDLFNVNDRPRNKFGMTILQKLKSKIYNLAGLRRLISSIKKAKNILTFGKPGNGLFPFPDAIHIVLHLAGIHTLFAMFGANR